MKSKSSIADFILCILKAFFIIYIFAVVIPRIIGFCLYYFIYKDKTYYNSTFVLNFNNMDYGFIKSYLYFMYKFLHFGN